MRDDLDEVFDRIEAASVPPKLREFRDALAPTLGKAKDVLERARTAKWTAAERALEDHRRFFTNARLDQRPEVRSSVAKARRLIADADTAMEGPAVLGRLIARIAGMQWEDVRDWELGALAYDRRRQLEDAMHFNHPDQFIEGPEGLDTLHRNVELILRRLADDGRHHRSNPTQGPDLDEPPPPRQTVARHGGAAFGRDS